MGVEGRAANMVIVNGNNPAMDEGCVVPLGADQVAVVIIDILKLYSARSFCPAMQRVTLKVDISCIAGQKSLQRVNFIKKGKF